MPELPAADSGSRSALFELTMTRLREFLREPEAVFWTFGFPLLLAAGLGIAFRNRAPETLRVAVLGSTPLSAQVTSLLKSEPRFVVDVLPDDSAARNALRTGSVTLVVVPAATVGSVEYRFDPARPDARTARLLVDQAIQTAAGRRDPVAVREATVRERGSRYIDFLIPGLLALNLMGSGIWSIAFGVVTARNKKLLKRLVATPMSRGQYLLSFLISRLAFLALEVGALVGFGMLVFGVPQRGAIGTLALVTLIASLAFSALGLLVASRARTVEAVSGLANLLMLPMWIFSGVFFSAANFPSVMQPYIQALPLTATADALRATMLQGVPLSSLGGELALITIWGMVPFVLALRLFRWR
jgi:ABC-type multidrug transport system permease subunit